MSTCTCESITLDCCDPNDFGYSADKIVLWQIGDFGVNEASGSPYSTPETEVRDLIEAAKADIILTSGDNDYVGDYSLSVGMLYGQWVEREKFFPVPGNHDWDYGGLTPFSTYFSYLNSRRYYERRWGPVHIFFLDSGYDTAEAVQEPDGITAGTLDDDLNPTGGSDQWNWFVERVVASTAPWKIAIAHHPDRTSGSSHGPYSALAWQWADLGIDLRIAGHEHSYERILASDGVTHVINGAGGQSLTGFSGTPDDDSVLRYNSNVGALKLEITMDKLIGTFLAYDGTRVDRFTLTK